MTITGGSAGAVGSEALTVFLGAKAGGAASLGEVAHPAAKEARRSKARSEAPNCTAYRPAPKAPSMCIGFMASCMAYGIAVINLG